MTILDIVRIVRSNLKLLLISMIAGILLAAGYTLTRPVQYQATSSVQVVAGNSSDANNAVLSQQLSTGRAPYYAQLAGGFPVAQNVISASHGALSGGDFSLAGVNGTGSQTIYLTATGSSAEKAQQAANLAPAALAKQAQYVETLNAPSHTTIYHVFPLTAAGRPSAPSSPNWKTNLMIGAVLGVLAGVAIVVLRKQLDSRIRHTNELEKITGAGVLGVIPKAKNLANETRGGLGSLGSTAEAFRMLRTNLRYVSAEHPPRSLVVTSAVQSEGKSTVSANLARVLAAAGQRVILVDTDLRRPVVHDTFKADNSVGLTEVLTGQVALADVIQPGDHKNLSLITAGRIPPNPSELLGSRRMSAIIDSLTDEYFVILDAPPLLPVTDGGLLAVAADGVAVVYHYGRTHREQVELCTKMLEQVGGNYFGSILNMTPPKEMGSAIYGYGAGNYGATGYGYGYGYGENSEKDVEKAVTPARRTHDLTLPALQEDEDTHASGATAVAAGEVANPNGVAVPANLGESLPPQEVDDPPVSRRSIRRNRGE